METGGASSLERVLVVTLHSVQVVGTPVKSLTPGLGQLPGVFWKRSGTTWSPPPSLIPHSALHSSPLRGRAAAKLPLTSAWTTPERLVPAWKRGLAFSIQQCAGHVSLRFCLQHCCSSVVVGVECDDRGCYLCGVGQCHVEGSSLRWVWGSRWCTTVVAKGLTLPAGILRSAAVWKWCSAGSEEPEAFTNTEPPAGWTVGWRRIYTSLWPCCLNPAVLLLPVCFKILRVVCSQMAVCVPRLCLSDFLGRDFELLLPFCHLKTSLAILLWPPVSMSHAEICCLLMQIFWNVTSLSPTYNFHTSSQQEPPCSPLW